MSGNISDTNPSKLGGGIPGFQPKLLGGGANTKSGSGMVGGQGRGKTRIELRKAVGKYNYLRKANILKNLNKTGLTPFRQVFIAGDYKKFGNEQYAGQDPRLPKINQVNSLGPTLLYTNGGAISQDKGGATFSGNPRYVYDSSDYVRFKNLTAQNKTYNDKSFGGDDFNGSYTFLMAVRRY
jgi:hypothetical protein